MVINIYDSEFVQFVKANRASGNNVNVLCRISGGYEVSVTGDEGESINPLVSHWEFTSKGDALSRARKLRNIGIGSRTAYDEILSIWIVEPIY